MLNKPELSDDMHVAYRLQPTGIFRWNPEILHLSLPGLQEFARATVALLAFHRIKWIGSMLSFLCVRAEPGRQGKCTSQRHFHNFAYFNFMF